MVTGRVHVGEGGLNDYFGLKYTPRLALSLTHTHARRSQTGGKPHKETCHRNEFVTPSPRWVRLHSLSGLMIERTFWVLGRTLILNSTCCLPNTVRLLMRTKRILDGQIGPISHMYPPFGPAQTHCFAEVLSPANVS